MRLHCGWCQLGHGCSVQQAVMQILSRRTLYPDEEVMILERLASDAMDLLHASPPESEDSSSYHQVQCACQQLAESLPTIQSLPESSDNKEQTFKEFQVMLDQVDWCSMIELSEHCGTYEDALISLSDVWETECTLPREASEDSVAMFSAEAFAPRTVRRAWRMLLQGRSQSRTGP